MCIKHLRRNNMCLFVDKNVIYYIYVVEVLTYHVVKGTVYSVGLSNGMVPTVEGKSVKVDISSGNMSYIYVIYKTANTMNMPRIYFMALDSVSKECFSMTFT